MYNELLHIGPLTIYGYGLMIGIGVLFAYITTEKRAAAAQCRQDLVFGLVFWAFAAGMLGCKVLYCITIWKDIAADPSILWDSIKNGFVVYGGLIGGILGGYLYCKYHKESFPAYFDLAMPSVALAQGFGRIGCFLAGCCYGRETTSKFAVTFTHSDFAPNNVALLPSQLISSALDFINFAFLVWFAKNHKKAHGQVGGVYLITYSIGRFFIEYLRGDVARGSVGILSTSQFIAIFTGIAGVLVVVISRKLEQHGIRAFCMTPAAEEQEEKTTKVYGKEESDGSERSKGSTEQDGEETDQASV